MADLWQLLTKFRSLLFVPANNRLWEELETRHIDGLRTKRGLQYWVTVANPVSMYSILGSVGGKNHRLRILNFI